MHLNASAISAPNSQTSTVASPDEVAIANVRPPLLREAQPAPNPLGYVPHDVMCRLFEELIPVRVPWAPLFSLSKTCIFFKSAIRVFLNEHANGQPIKQSLQAFKASGPFSEAHIRKRGVELADTFFQHRIFEQIRECSFRAGAFEGPGQVAKIIDRHEGGLRHPLRLLWPMEGGWGGNAIASALRRCAGKSLNLVFNDTLFNTLVREMFPALRACAPGCAVILELRRTELDDGLLADLGRLCQEHPVIYQISLQSWKPRDPGVLSRFVTDLMRLPNAVQIIDMNYGTPVTDEVALAIAGAIADLSRPIELRFPTRGMSEHAMKTLIQAALLKNETGGVLARLELHVGEDMFTPANAHPDSHHLDKLTKSRLKKQGVSFSKVRGISEEKSPDLLFWL